ncbi:MAG TPA: TonB-dependent receptor, partial [Nevskiaceae bacterium]|nr:TonB-dependent receptor [Nevskiaceae bacterium]
EARERQLTLFDVDEVEYGTRIGAVYLEPLGFFTPLLRTQFDALAADLPDLPIDVLKDADVRKKSWNTVTPAATLAVKASDDWLRRLHLDSGLWYATYSEGFTAGGFEPRGPELVPFEPEELKNYEIGMKLDALDSRLRFNAALYYMDYTNIQVRVAEQGARISDLFLFLSNAAKATVKGAEIETTLLLGDAVLTASATYTDATYGDYLTTIVIPGQGQSTADRSSEPFFMVPEFSWSLGAQYNLLTPIGMLVPRIGMYARDEVFTGYDYLAASYESSTLDDLTLWNARLSYIPGERLRVTAYVDNLTNERYFRSGFSLSALLGSATLVQGQERTMGIELTYEFF